MSKTLLRPALSRSTHFDDAFKLCSCPDKRPAGDFAAHITKLLFEGRDLFALTTLLQFTAFQSAFEQFETNFVLTNFVFKLAIVLPHG